MIIQCGLYKKWVQKMTQSSLKELGLYVILNQIPFVALVFLTYKCYHWFLHFTISLFWIIVHEYLQFVMRHFAIQHYYIILVSYQPFCRESQYTVAWNTTNCTFSQRGHSPAISIMEGSGLCLCSLCSGYEDLEHGTGFKGLSQLYSSSSQCTHLY